MAIKKEIDISVIEKVRGRWELTSLGQQTNELTKTYLKTQHELLFDNLRNIRRLKEQERLAFKRKLRH